MEVREPCHVTSQFTPAPGKKLVDWTKDLRSIVGYFCVASNAIIHSAHYFLSAGQAPWRAREGGREGEREGGREGGRQGGREGEREGGRALSGAGLRLTLRARRGDGTEISERAHTHIYSHTHERVCRKCSDQGFVRPPL
jgi:hypothetical protein